MTHLSLVLLFSVSAIAAAGCAGKSKAIAVQADATVYAMLSSVQAGADLLVKEGKITVDTRREIAPYLLKALQLGRAFNRAARADQPLEAVAPLLDALRILKLQLSRWIPASLGGNLIAEVERAIGIVAPPPIGDVELNWRGQPAMQWLPGDPARVASMQRFFRRHGLQYFNHGGLLRYCRNREAHPGEIVVVLAPGKCVIARAPNSAIHGAATMAAGGAQ